MCNVALCIPGTQFARDVYLLVIFNIELVLWKHLIANVVCSRKGKNMRCCSVCSSHDLQRGIQTHTYFLI